MTQDTYVRIVKAVLATNPSIRIHDSHQSKLNALGRLVQGGKRPEETVSDIKDIFGPDIDRGLEKALEKALR